MDEIAHDRVGHRTLIAALAAPLRRLAPALADIAIQDAQAAQPAG